MSFKHIDLLGLNRFDMAGAPIVSTAAEIKQRFDADVKMSVAGMRHSQGGHTALQGGEMLITETMNAMPVFHGGTEPPKDDDAKPPETVTVDAGMTWAELHFHLGYRRGAPWVQQSSAHFSIGGSISVNCHGRDINYGTLSSTVESLQVLAGDGKTYTASRTENNVLFRAVIGGYGACGVILSATLKVAPNYMLQRSQSRKPLNLNEYAAYLAQIENSHIARLQMHHGWLNITKDNYLNQVIAYDVQKKEDQASGNVYGSQETGEFKHEKWGESELLRAGWAAMHGDAGMKQQIWGELTTSRTVDGSRIDFLRESISFTQERIDVDGKGVDMLQEYFVPLSQFEAFMVNLKLIFPYNDGEQAEKIQLNSITTRYIRKDADERALSYLTYCPLGESRVSVAIDAYVPFAGGKPCTLAAGQFVKAIKTAISLGGSYYLPYYPFADVDLFNQAYPHKNLLIAAVDKYNPKLRFSNQFLQQFNLH